MNVEDMIKSLATSVTTFVDQTKDNLLGVQEEIKELKTTVDTMATEMKADREAQKKAAADAGRKLNKAVAGIGEQVAQAVASDMLWRLPLRLLHIFVRKSLPSSDQPISAKGTPIGNIERSTP